jgi:hypothetical protein
MVQRIERSSLQFVEDVKEAVKANPGPEGIEVILADNERCRIRIKRGEGTTYYGVTDKGRGFFMNLATGQFDRFVHPIMGD